MIELVAVSRTTIEGALAVIASFVLFAGAVWLLLAAIFGVRMGYLMMATGMFGFMIVLSALWVFGAPGTPRFLGPKGELPSWVAVGEGVDLSSSTYPVIEEYPGGPWRGAQDEPELSAEVEAASLAFQELLAERANEELEAAGIEGEVSPETFTVTDIRFTESDGTDIAAARAFATTGGPEVTVLAFKDRGDEPLPSWLFFAASIIGFVAHLPFLDRAERRRKEVLTGGAQSPWRGPA